LAYTITVDRYGPGGKTILVTLAGAAVTTALEAAIPGLPRYLTFLRCEASLTSGTATLIDPVLGANTNPADVAKGTTGRNVFINGAAAASISFIPTNGFTPVETTGGFLYYRDVITGGSSDNVTAVRLYFRVGW